MKDVCRTLALGVLAVVALALPQPAGATCASTQPMQHGLGSYFANCPDAGPVDGYLFVLGQEATLNSNSTAAGAGADQKIDFVCEATAVLTEQLIDCTPEAGVTDDGNVTVMFDWGGINLSNGSACPNAAGVPGVGRNVIQIIANGGASLIATVGFSIDFGYYIVESAAQFQNEIVPMSCSYANGLALASANVGLQAQNICILQSAPPIYSDCDPGSVGSLFLNTCQGDTGTPVTVTPGNLYTVTAPCSATPDMRRSSWTPLVTTPGPGGSKCGVIDIPASGSLCNFIGGSSLIGDGANAPAESSALTGWFRVPCGNRCTAAVDEVAITKAELRQGRLHVDFGTQNEATIAGFNVYGGAAKLNTGLIPAVGQGSNSYSFEAGRGSLKNERTITIEAVLSNGTTVRSAAVSAK